MKKPAGKHKSQNGLDINQQIKFLKKIDFFHNFDEHELRQFLAVTKWLKVPKGKVIIKENTMERVFYILVKGEVKVVKTVEGNKQIELTTLKSGACFGEMSLVMDIKRTAGVISNTESFILMVEPGIINTSNVFLQLKFYKRFSETLVSRLIQANERMASITDEQKTTKKPAMHATQPAIEKKATAHPSANDETTEPNKDQDAKEELRGDAPATVVTNEKKLPPLPEKRDRIAKKKLHTEINASLILPINPHIAKNLDPLLVGERENTRLLADLIQLDPVISCRVVQLANSSYFRRSTPVASVPHAMITVGTKQIQEELAKIINQTASVKPFQGFTDVASAYWRHSVVVARIATLLKDILRLNISTDVYLAGLIHDIGVLALDQLEPDFYPHLSDSNAPITQSLNDAEIEYLGSDHGQAGYWFGQSLSLPEAFTDVMRFHHNLENCRDNALVTAITQLANLFASQHECGLYSHPENLLEATLTSFGWIIIQENHRPFIEVNLTDFVTNFNEELSKTWGSVTGGLDF